MSGDEIAVHPAAALFPMLSADELADLAEDIKVNGLLHPITLDAKGILIDGRNRLAACRLAGVEPTFTNLNGHDPVAFILSSNIERRHMSTGQRAMAVAMVDNFNSEIIGHGHKGAAADAADVRRARVSQARTVLQYAPDVAALVLSGAEHLNAAYEQARKRKLAQESQTEADARALAETNAKTARLRADAPDLAELVAEWRISLEDAIAALDVREQRERERKQRGTLGFAKATSYLYALLQPDPEQIAGDWTPAENTLSGIAGCENLWTSAGLAELAAWLKLTAEAWEDTRR